MSSIAHSQEKGFKPQIWSNANIGWNSDNGFTLLNTTSYNVLLSNDLPWNEFSNTFSTAYAFNPHIAVIGEFYTSRTKQSTTLSSSELRPAIALRLSTSNENRWRIANNSKLEFRFMNYTNESRDNTLRFRNKTLISVALKEMNLEQDGSIVLYSYFEIFRNLEKSTVERFFTSAKVKLGTGYRLNYNWRFDFGVIYLDAYTTIDEPSVLPTNIVTKFIVDFGVYYIL